MKQIEYPHYNVYINDWPKLQDQIVEINPSTIFVIVDENTEKYCLHRLLDNLEAKINIIRTASGEYNKSLSTCQTVWTQLIHKGADRHSLIINLGGGVVGDLGGFCASTYMRGIHFIHLPTTLLSQVDSSAGGKTGVDFRGFKNIIGVISDPDAVFVFTEFLETLDPIQIRSGYAELLKYGLIADKKAWKSLSSISELKDMDFESLVFQALNTKRDITSTDPYEIGLRKILNFGHTIGHAIESYWMDSRTPLLHGEAVAIGMISEAFLSYRIGKITESELFEIRKSIIRLYGHHPKYVKPHDNILKLMKSDKKNINGEYRFALLDSVGKACYDVPVSPDFVEESLMFYSEKLD